MTDTLAVGQPQTRSILLWTKIQPGLAAFLLILTTPLMLMIAIGLKASGSGPVLFRQARTGLDGRPFMIFKFRTLKTDGSGQCSRFGRFLRCSSLDELPQLWNVMRGEMALVGPRPHMAADDVRYLVVSEHYTRRQSVLPGMTGLAQIRGLRGPTTDENAMARRIDCDLDYLARRSILLDLRILVATIRTVLQPFGQK
ncbi:sugar transferase [Thalassospira sp.]|uniref:sugar transferase n=1 Tax=Thalassospira sp. TaxID=1912094 RepID=UPI002735DF95|nr:sugar transferase [Thalassospira sp.]MDP2699136.1 sugar transferase [Thalassospira sp.]